MTDIAEWWIDYLSENINNTGGIHLDALDCFELLGCLKELEMYREQDKVTCND